VRDNHWILGSLSMRRESRLLSLVNTPRAVSLFGMACACLVAIYFAAFSLDAGARVVATLLAGTGFILGLRVLRDGHRRPFAVQMVVVVLLTLLMQFDSEGQPQTLESSFLMYSARLVFLGGMTCLLLGGLGLLQPIRALFLCGSFSVAILLAMMGMELFSETPPVEIASAPPAHPLVSRRDWSKIIANELCWIGTPGIELPDGLEYICRPHAFFKTAYPSDPRRYFTSEPVYGSIDLRLGKLVTLDADGKIDLPLNRDGIVRLSSATSDPEAPWRLGLQYARIPFLEGCRYDVSIQLRARAPRSLKLRILDGKDGFANLTPEQTFEVTSDWKTYSFSFTPSRTTTDGLITIDFANAAIDVEIRDIRVDALSGDLLEFGDPRLWRPTENMSQQPREGTPGVSWSPDIGAASGQPLLRDLVPLRAGGRYSYYLQARASRSAKLQLSVATSEALATPRGLARELSLEPEWQDVYGELVATTDTDDAVLAFGVPSEACTIEIADCRFWPTAGAVPTEPPHRSVVNYELNSLGFRDGEYRVGAQKDTFRIACLGDSFTFGQGVHEPDTFVRKLAGLLESSQSKIEVMNFGICGYSTRQERLCFEESVLRFEPDLVLVTMVTNDNMTIKEEQERGINRAPAVAPRLISQIRQSMSGSTHADYGYETCVDELKLLKAKTDGYGAKLGVVIFANRPQEEWELLASTVSEGMEGTGVPILNLKNALAEVPESIQQVHPLDAHPSEIAHGIAAREIAAFLKKQQLLPPHILIKQ
jgi:hypothetical protein